MAATITAGIMAISRVIKRRNHGVDCDGDHCDAERVFTCADLSRMNAFMLAQILQE